MNKLGHDLFQLGIVIAIFYTFVWFWQTFIHRWPRQFSTTDDGRTMWQSKDGRIYIDTGELFESLCKDPKILNDTKQLFKTYYKR